MLERVAPLDGRPDHRLPVLPKVFGRVRPLRTAPVVAYAAEPFGMAAAQAPLSMAFMLATELLYPALRPRQHHMTTLVIWNHIA
jgi:hypothetical protein